MVKYIIIGKLNFKAPRFAKPPRKSQFYLIEFADFRKFFECDESACFESKPNFKI